MGNIASGIASQILPSIMSMTGAVVKGVGTYHGPVTSFVSKVATMGLFYAWNYS